MKHPIDEPKMTLPDPIAEASKQFKSRRDQILALTGLSGWEYIIEYFESIEKNCIHLLRTAPLDTDSDKKNLHVIRGEYNIVEDFLQFIKNLKADKEKKG